MSGNNAVPLVTIAVPIFNEARFIDSSLRSLRSQDYPNLEIVVSDNASTDETLEICQRHAAEDPRIRILRAECNVGVTPNFQKTLDGSQGKYFMWAAGHDLWTPNLVSECVRLLEAHPGASVAFGSCTWIDGDGQPYPRQSGWTDTRGMGPIARMATIFWGNMHPVVGVIRGDVLRSLPPISNFAGGDLVLLADLVLRGDFVHASQATWSRREFRHETHHDDKLRRYASADSGITRSLLWRVFPLLRLPLALLGVVKRAGLPVVDRLALQALLLVSFPVRYWVGRRGG